MSINSTLQNLRVAYLSSLLDTKDCSPDPALQFDKWLQNALDSGCDEPNAFVLSTVVNGQPHGRVVLLKGREDHKFLFYTNYESAKGKELKENSRVAMTFLWLPLARQVRIEGTVEKVSADVSDQYFKQRPRGSQVGAFASPQSQKMSSREELELLFEKADDKFRANELIPRPLNWGGYAISPQYFEFWQGRDNRMHDRICYEKNLNEWKMFRLAP